MSNENGGMEFFAGLFVGGLLGAAAALLMAPQSGEETRAQIMERSDDLRQTANESMADARVRADAIVADARTRAEKIVADARVKADEIQLQAKERAADLQTRGKTAFEAQSEKIKEVTGKITHRGTEDTPTAEA